MNVERGHIVKTYRAMLAEIERLQRKAEARRRVEIKGVVKHIRELIAQHGLTGHDLGLDGAKASAAPRQFPDGAATVAARGRRRGKPARAAASKGVPRYRDPATGKTWTGRGKPPNWIVGAKDRKPFEIGAPAAPVKAAAAKKTQAVKAKRTAKPAKKAAVKKAPAPARAPKATKATKPAKAAKATKAAKLPKPPVPKAAAKRTKAPKPASPAPAPADAGAATPAPSA
jgi:DNA-binding protein H-NS